jgi:hypothetical protein
MNEDSRHGERLANWCQTPDTRIPDAEVAAEFIARVGLATVFAVSPEIPDLFHAHMGDPDARTEMEWDSPSGLVYSWRWVLGRKKAGFYGTVVRKRPTFVCWSLLPIVLRLWGDLRPPDELFDLGVISAEAYRICEVIERSDRPLSTGEIRREAGFPTGKDYSKAYHKAIDELGSRMVITTEFPADDAGGEGSKHHGLTYSRHPEAMADADRLRFDDAMEEFLRVYLRSAVYVVPKSLARDLKVPVQSLTESLERISAPTA